MVIGAIVVIANLIILMNDERLSMIDSLFFWLVQFER